MCGEGQGGGTWAGKMMANDEDGGSEGRMRKGGLMNDGVQVK